MKTIQRVLSAAAGLWLAGVLFILFLLGYCFYGVLWAIRFIQTRRLPFLPVVALCVLLGAGAAAWYLFLPLRKSARTETVVVHRGATLRAVADSLYDRRIIASRTAFLLWLRMSGHDRSVQAGKYAFARGEGAVSAVRSLSGPAPLETSVTVPEGLTIEQTASRIAAFHPLDTAEFARLCRDPGFIRRTQFPGAPSLEGYLFPDTYRFLEEAAPASVIGAMVARFSEAFATLDAAPAASRGLSGRDIVILASIVEKEAALAEERPRIAGVFYNRLRLGLPLGADPTVRYALKKFGGPLSADDLNAASPYNTRCRRGLPPGPICSPGLASLQATVSPAETNELYFVAKWDGSGGHEFSVTNEEHSRKKILIRRKNAARLRNKGE
jgi:UPF0755 protein